jgi:hypothetical protein
LLLHIERTEPLSAHRRHGFERLAAVINVFLRERAPEGLTIIVRGSVLFDQTLIVELSRTRMPLTTRSPFRSRVELSILTVSLDITIQSPFAGGLDAPCTDMAMPTKVSEIIQKSIRPLVLLTPIVPQGTMVF